MSDLAPPARPEPATVKVSVVIPCFNSSAFLAETVASVLAQTLRDCEIVFVDDGSTDDTRPIIEHLMAACADRPMHLVSQTNAGVAAARNRGIAEARGRYVLPLDADDLIAPTMLEECAVLLDADAEIAVVYTDRRDFGDVDGEWPAGKFALGHLKYFNQIAYCSLFRRSMWEDLGGYRVNVTGFDDWDFWVAAAARGYRGKHLPKPLLRHRRHRQSHLWRIVGEYERLHARIILNNRGAYSAAEVEIADRFLREGTASALLTSARIVFLGRYYAGYESTPT